MSFNNDNNDNVPIVIFYFHPSDEFKSFLKRLPSTHFLPISSVHLLWGSDWDLQARYRLLQSSLEIQRLKIQRTARKLFSLSIRCHHNPNHQMPRERWVETQPWCGFGQEQKPKIQNSFKFHLNHKNRNVYLDCLCLCEFLIDELHLCSSFFFLPVFSCPSSPQSAEACTCPKSFT